MLYDYSTQDAWLNHPVKRFKPDGKENKFNKKMDLYAMYHHNGISPCNDIANVNIVKQEIKQEPGPIVSRNIMCLSYSFILVIILLGFK